MLMSHYDHQMDTLFVFIIARASTGSQSQSVGTVGVNDMIREGERAAPTLSCIAITAEEPLSKASICSVHCTFTVTAAEV